jgi:hypothetical protein
MQYYEALPSVQVSIKIRSLRRLQALSKPKPSREFENIHVHEIIRAAVLGVVFSQRSEPGIDFAAL